MFKKIQDWLFKEDYEDLDFEEKNDYMEEVVYEERKRKVEPKIKETVVYEEEIPYHKPAAPKMNIDIKVDDPIVEEKKVEKPAVVQKSRMTLTRKDEYEMPPVISPYFGVKGEELQANEDVPTLNTMGSTTSKKETFNSVISPFYGQKKSQKPIQQTLAHHEEVKHDEVFKSNVEEANDVSDEIYDEDNISLDEIVSANNNNADDLIQFSLFGEDKRIQDEEFENEDIEKIEANDNEQLPF